MDWEDGRRSGNVEDRRGMRIPGGLAGGGGIGVVVIALIAMFFGVDPRLILQGAGQVGSGVQQPAAPPNPAQDKLEDFVSVVLADTEDTWGDLFAKSGSHYEQPKLVLFTGAVHSACGTAQSAVGPFYCPGDRRVYIDLDFYRLLADRFGAPGDFAQAYVIAHEVGHHVQNLLGISEKVLAASQRSPGRANQFRFARNSRPIAWRASGDTLPIVRGGSFRPAISSKVWQRRRRSAMTGCSSRRRDMYRRKPSHMAVPNNGCAGSSAASIREISGRATRSRLNHHKLARGLRSLRTRVKNRSKR